MTFTPVPEAAHVITACGCVSGPARGGGLVMAADENWLPIDQARFTPRSVAAEQSPFGIVDAVISWHYHRASWSPAVAAPRHSHGKVSAMLSLPPSLSACTALRRPAGVPAAAYMDGGPVAAQSIWLGGDRPNPRRPYLWSSVDNWVGGAVPGAGAPASSSPTPLPQLPLATTNDLTGLCLTAHRQRFGDLHQWPSAAPDLPWCRALMTGQCHCPVADNHPWGRTWLLRHPQSPSRRRPVGTIQVDSPIVDAPGVPALDNDLAAGAGADLRYQNGAQHETWCDRRRQRRRSYSLGRAAR